MQVPAQPADDASPFCHKRFAMIRDQPHLPVGTIQAGDRQVRFALRSPRDGKGIDRIRLAVGPRRVPRVRHQLGRHPHDRLTCGEQVAFQPPRQMAAVLDRPHQVLAVGDLLGPSQQREVILGPGRDCLDRELAALRVDRDDRMRALVRIDAESDHQPVSFHRGEQGSAGGHIPVRGEATLLSSHADRSLQSGGPH